LILKSLYLYTFANENDSYMPQLLKCSDYSKRISLEGASFPSFF